LALVLLTTAGLMVRSFLRVQAVETGFRSDGVLVFDLQLPRSYSSEASQVFLFDQITARLDALPAVHAAGAISYLPLGGGQNRGRFAIEGDPPAAPGHEPSAERRIVTPGYFAAMGIPIRRGRVFTGYDTRDQPRVVVINETMASQYFRDRDPIGRRLTAGGRVRTVIGVVSDVKSSALESDVPPQLYVPHAQWAWAGMSVVLHTEGNTLTHVSAVRAELKALDPDLAAANIRTMTQVVSKATSARRFNTALVVFFSVAALILTMIGIYGVVAFLVGRRSHEFGIRMALGAQRADILRLVLGQGMTPVALGALGGLAGSIAASRFLASQLYGVSPTDPLTFITIAGLLGSAALLACLLPARRATKVAPVEALRGD
jgi:putative ABC transport system permease protein